jgi:hypothetical protein
MLPLFFVAPVRAFAAPTSAAAAQGSQQGGQSNQLDLVKSGEQDPCAQCPKSAANEGSTAAVFAHILQTLDMVCLFFKGKIIKKTREK